MTAIPPPPADLGWDAIRDRIGVEMRAILRDEARQAYDIQAKDSEVAGDLVTAVDLRVQARLHQVLQALLPGSLFLGEEGFSSPGALGDSFVWIVDPLDGTLNFASDLPFFASSIGLFFGGQPVLGVVYDAASDALYDALWDGPARRDGVPVHWDATRADRAPIGISSGFLALMRRDPAGYEPGWLGQRFRIFGSQAVQLCWAAQGRLRLNINLESKLWDDAAGALICQRAGAGHAALNAAPFFPLDPAGDALAGKNLFSVSGSPDLVARCVTEFAPER